MQNNAFTPFGPTVLVGTLQPVQAPSTNGSQSTSYRIRNVAAAAGYIAWAPPTATGQPPSAGAVAPSANTPSPNTLGMAASAVERFCLPANAWFIASAGTFEVTPGEGI